MREQRKREENEEKETKINNNVDDILKLVKRRILEIRTYTKNKQNNT